MKILVLLALCLGGTLARPTDIIDIEQDHMQHEQEGEPGTAVEGEYSWVAPDGEEYKVKYKADHMGYRIIDSNVVPEVLEVDPDANEVVEVIVEEEVPLVRAVVVEAPAVVVESPAVVVEAPAGDPLVEADEEAEEEKAQNLVVEVSDPKKGPAAEEPAAEEPEEEEKGAEEDEEEKDAANPEREAPAAPAEEDTEEEESPEAEAKAKPSPEEDDEDSEVEEGSPPVRALDPEEGEDEDPRPQERALDSTAEVEDDDDK